MNILVIDNDPNALERVAARLRAEKPGGKILTFTDPLLAVKYGYNHPVDMVYAKTVMRGLGGGDVARLLRNVHPYIQMELLDA
ncbi:MAG: hypothetical protein Q4C72_07745 [Eubacteriales bacterium]|nr:hypothetical protein [Eubacteriales bacterium]